MPRPRSEPKFTRLSAEDRRNALIEAGLACLARGGIQAFTIDKICVEAGVSRGLITHHFGAINGLLAAVYGRIYRDTTPHPSDTVPGAPRLAALLDAYFQPKVFNRDVLNIWIALWGQISNIPELGDEHRRQYDAYLGEVADAIAELASQRGRTVDAGALAATLICLVDGLGLQHCIDPKVMPAARARALCVTLLEPHLGPLR